VIRSSPKDEVARAVAALLTEAECRGLDRAATVRHVSGGCPFGPGEGPERAEWDRYLERLPGLLGLAERLDEVLGGVA
jgi:hypothetical protein